MTTEFLETLAKLVPLLTLLGGTVTAIWKIIKEWLKYREGQRCLLRAEMLKIYYHNKDHETIRQYELQNFILMYKAYKAMNGNSFIDEINEFVTSWEIVT